MAKRNREIKKPYWQTQPCPSWCWGTHAKHDGGPDRTHFSRWEGKVMLSTPDALMVNPNDSLDVEPFTLEVTLRQGYREVEPTVHVCQAQAEAERWRKLFNDDNGMVDLPFTLAEAERLAKRLLRAVRLAQSSR
ncbi:MAG TPA: hypothetical protein VGX25_23095 [Actinophytocola sp.]|uniref:DUF6907 domain-containing protein n=1 Tax=Actinophytocola sp. TaxID=1872138 RepID=UPI002DDCDAF6|nr:hypothetical protein [Actinophytocola sp.]HEV2782288.1 hypothetical protein [Actinophytocola sp.]